MSRWSSKPSALRSFSRGSTEHRTLSMASTRRWLSRGSTERRSLTSRATSICFLTGFDSAVANMALGGRDPIATTRNSVQYGRSLVGGAVQLVSHAVDVPAIETFIDRAGATVCGYLSEEARTQGLAHPVPNASWSAFQTAIAEGDADSPFGAAQATKITSAAGANFHTIYIASPAHADANHAYSLVVKRGAHRYMLLFADGTTKSLALDLQTGLAVGTPVGISLQQTRNMGDGWWRVEVLVATNATPNISIGFSDAAGAAQPTMAGTETIYVAHVQYEAGDFRTSPILTGNGVRAPTLLRYAGGLNVADGPAPRTYVTRFVAEPGRSGYLWSISDGGSDADRIYATIEPSTGVARVRTAITTGDAGDVTGSTDLTDGAEHEIRALLADGSLRLIVDGVEEGTADTSVTIPQGLDRWDVGADESVANHLNGNITELACYRGLVAA